MRIAAASSDRCCSPVRKFKAGSGFVRIDSHAWARLSPGGSGKLVPGPELALAGPAAIGTSAAAVEAATTSCRTRERMDPFMPTPSFVATNRSLQWQACPLDVGCETEGGQAGIR